MLDNEVTAIKLDDINSNPRLQLSAEKALAMQMEKSMTLKIIKKFFSLPFLKVFYSSHWIRLSLHTEFLDEYRLLFLTPVGNTRWELVAQLILRTRNFYLYLLIVIADYLHRLAKTVMPMIIYMK